MRSCCSNEARSSAAAYCSASKKDQHDPVEPTANNSWPVVPDANAIGDPGTMMIKSHNLCFNNWSNCQGSQASCCSIIYAQYICVLYIF